MKGFNKNDLNEINIFFNDFLQRNSDYQFFFDHLPEIGYTCESLRKVARPYYPVLNKVREDTSYKQFPVYSINLRLHYAQKFYQQHQIDFDVNEIVNRGFITPNINTYVEETEKERIYYPYLGGFCKNDKTKIEVPNTGYISDTAILIHELSHYRNALINISTPAREVFTETIAYTEEFIFWNDNEKVFSEAPFFKRSSLKTLLNTVINIESVVAMLIVYIKCGDISKSSYELYFGESDDYDYELDVLVDYLNHKKYSIFQSLEYVIALLLFPYMYYRYLEDKTYMTKIQELHELIKTESILTCLNHIGIKEVSFEQIKTLSEFYGLLLSENFSLEKEDTKKLEL